MDKKKQVIELLEKYSNETDMFKTFITRDEFVDLAEEIVKLFAIPDVSNLLCGFFEPKNDNSSATICKHCGREKWMHQKAT